MTDGDLDAAAVDGEPVPAADAVTGEIVTGELVPARAEPATELMAYPPLKALGGLPYARDFMRLAQTIHQTELVPKDFRGRPDAIMAACMYGFELGLGPMQALSGINVIDGKPSQSAELMRALIVQEGHMFILRQDDEVATVRCRRKDWPADEPTVEVAWTVADAKRAGLVEWHERWTKTDSGRNRKLTWNPHSDEPRPQWVTEDTRRRSSSWTNYTRAMLGARATSEAARAVFADVLKGMSYTPDEVRFDAGVVDVQVDVPSPAPAEPPAPTSADAPKPVRKAQEAAKETPAVEQSARPGDGELQPVEERSPLLPNGEVRVNDTQVRAIVTGFGRLDVNYAKPERLRYVRNVLSDESITSTWDLSETQADELIVHLREINGEEPTSPRERRDAEQRQVEAEDDAELERLVTALPEKVARQGHRKIVEEEIRERFAEDPDRLARSLAVLDSLTASA